MNTCVMFGIILINFFANLIPEGLDSSEEPCDYKLPGYDLGASCEYDEDCVADHSYCRNQQICQCRRGFVPATDGITCVANIGARCQTKFDCMTLPQSDCRQDVCQCEPDFVPDPTGTQCLPRARDIKDVCQLNNQCQVSFGDQSHCYSGHCECTMRHHFSNGRCFLTKELNEYCGNSSECYIGQDYTQVIECVGQRCQCILGYYIDEYKKCKRSAGNDLNVSSLSISFITLIFIIIHFI